jgi:hypothetical protein
MRWQVLLCVVIVLTIYLLIGAVVFNALEHRYDAQHNSHGNETRGGDTCLVMLIKNEVERKNRECVGNYIFSGIQNRLFSVFKLHLCLSIALFLPCRYPVCHVTIQILVENADPFLSGLQLMTCG